MKLNTCGKNQPCENFIYLGIKLTNNAIGKIKKIINSHEKNKKS